MKGKPKHKTEMMADWHRRQTRDQVISGLALSGDAEDIGKRLNLDLDERYEYARSVVREIVRDGAIGGELS